MTTRSPRGAKEVPGRQPRPTAPADDTFNPDPVAGAVSPDEPRRVTAYIDYGSPYSYQSWYRISQRPERYPVEAFDWVPVSAGHLFAKDGGKPNAEYPNMLAYNKRDLERWAAALDIPYKMSPVFPQRTLAAARIHHHLRTRDPKMADAWTAAAFHAHWVDAQDLGRPETLVKIAGGMASGLDVAAVSQDAEAKAALVTATDAAYAAGAPGVPYFVLEDEGFWGHDRIDWVLARLVGKDAPELA